MRGHPTTLADAVQRFRDSDGAEEGTFSVLLDEFLDVFYTEDNWSARQVMIDEEPSTIGKERLDAYVGAVAEHLARRWNLQIPPWSEQSWREVAEPWFVGMMGKELSPMLLVESPIAFRRRRIFTEAEPLRRARMPGQPVREAAIRRSTP